MSGPDLIDTESRMNVLRQRMDAAAVCVRAAPTWEETQRIMRSLTYPIAAAMGKLRKQIEALEVI